MRDILYEGIRFKYVAGSYFIRNYNFFFTLRFNVIIVLIFNLQYLQMVQILSSFLFQLWFAVQTILLRKTAFFKRKYTHLTRIIQEVSMTLIIVIICMVFYDNNYKSINNSSKARITIFFLALVIVNILLEVIGAVLMLIQLAGDHFKTKSR
jgi:hypothetical protein